MLGVLEGLKDAGGRCLGWRDVGGSVKQRGLSWVRLSCAASREPSEVFQSFSLHASFQFLSSASLSKGMWWCFFFWIFVVLSKIKQVFCYFRNLKAVFNLVQLQIYSGQQTVMHTDLYYGWEHSQTDTACQLLGLCWGLTESSSHSECGSMKREEGEQHCIWFRWNLELTETETKQK